ncbi:MAG: DUF3576 domain-containing protein [Rickettsia endosymbiont of Bryobia graminum]|nr:DUF3576 domain-containing protein [Rickettsia endosymbiont of Bryobia graminum]
MKKYLKHTIKIITPLLFYSNAIAVTTDYPQTIHEKEMEDMGSILGGEGIVFRPGKVKNESTKIGLSHINKYLWQASIDSLSSIPLASTDSNGGVIITEWHSPKDKQNFRFKVNIIIKDNVISPDAIQVRVFEQILKNGTWVDSNNSNNLAIIIEDTILRKARELHLSSKEK